MDERGYVKFNCEWVRTGPLSADILKDMNVARGRLYERGLVGAYADGTGFGNVSIRSPGGPGTRFIITGTATGGFRTLASGHYTHVTDFDFAKNWLRCEGPIKASSESLSHAAVYVSDPSAMAVVHVHSRPMWERFVGRLPTTSRSAEYGTPEMAAEISKLFAETNVKDRKAFVMGGHEEGLVSFGASLAEAIDAILGLAEAAGGNDLSSKPQNVRYGRARERRAKG